MTSLKYSKPERIWLKDHPELDERWLQDRIGEINGVSNCLECQAC